MYISVTALEVARRLAAYNAAESCGKGTLAGRERLASSRTLTGWPQAAAPLPSPGWGQMACGSINSLLHLSADEELSGHHG
jgi:hypothetical protein